MPSVAADQYVSKVRMPEDIDLFWGEDLAETAKNPLEPEVAHDPLRSTEQIDVYEVFFTSLDRVRIAAWYAGHARGKANCRAFCRRRATTWNRRRPRSGRAKAKRRSA